MEDIGWVERQLIKFFGKNYKTTVPGLASSLCTPILIADQFIAHPTLHTAAAICGAIVGGSAGLIGIASKANNVTGAGTETRVVAK